MKKIVLIVAVLLALSCSSGGGGEDEPERLRIVHALASAGLLDVYVDDTQVTSGLAYGEDTGYFEAPEGTVQVRVSESDEAGELLDAEQTIAAGADSSLLIVEQDDVAAFLLITDTNTAPDIDQGKVRIGHVAPSLDSLDVYITRPDVRISDVSPSVAALELAAFSNYVDVNSGEVQIRVTNNDSTRVILDSEPFELLEGEIVTFLVLDEEGGGTPPTGVIIVDRSGS